MNTVRKVRVAVADDTQLVLRVCSCLVTGCRRAELVGTANNGLELVKLCRSVHPDLVLVDVHMPVMNGLQAVGCIKEEHPNIRIVFLTGDDSEETKQKCIDLGAFAVLPKFTSQTELCALMEELIGKCPLPPHESA